MAPAIFQSAIDTDFDIRVVVVGRQVFAAAISAHLAKDQYKYNLDWHIGNHDGALTFTPFRLPSDIEQKCVKHVEMMGLRYGAIDLVQDKRGKVWFLENNPNGQWAFVEEATGQPIGKALAELLETHKL